MLGEKVPEKDSGYVVQSAATSLDSPLQRKQQRKQPEGESSACKGGGGKEAGRACDPVALASSWMGRGGRRAPRKKVCPAHGWREGGDVEERTALT